MPSERAYPWFFFTRIARLSFLAFLPVLIFLHLLDRDVFLKILPLALASYSLFLFLFYRATRPLGSILSKVRSFKVDVPFDKTLQLLYRRDEWVRVEEALNEADLQLKDQVKLVRAENEKIAAILESIHDSIIAIDSFEGILFFNSNFKRNFMRQENTTRIWQTFSDEKVLDAFRTVLKSGSPMAVKGISFPTSPVPDRFFDINITSLKGADGKISGALGVFYDVTEFKLTEQMRVDFVANVSHEIRTPLTSVKGYTQLLEAQKAKVDPSLHLFLDKIIVNTERMISLFNDLLNLSVIESKNMLKLEELPLSPLIESVAQNIVTNYPAKRVKVDLELHLETIRADQRLIEQVISNLIDNACKYAGDDINIKVTTFSKDGKGLIVVTDNGPGIPREHLQRIFERFYRIDSSRESSRGTGLGLSIVKHIISKHGGRIWAESQENGGSSFIVELPI